MSEIVCFSPFSPFNLLICINSPCPTAAYVPIHDSIFSLKDKAAILISGFNSMSKDQRKMYDQKKMSKDQRNAFLIWGLIFAVGAILANFISQFFAIIAFIVWLIIFFKDVHLDEEKAFGKYKIK